MKYPSVDAIIAVNREVVRQTGESHDFDEDDLMRLERVISGMMETGEEGLQERESMVKKASSLLFHIARGQCFHEGNKRTALASTAAFLEMNGYAMPIEDSEREHLLGRISIGAPEATLIRLEYVMRRLVIKR